LQRKYGVRDARSVPILAEDPEAFSTRQQTRLLGRPSAGVCRWGGRVLRGWAAAREIDLADSRASPGSEVPARMAYLPRAAA